MESYQPPHHYMRPPPAPPSMGSDPAYHQQQQPPPPANNWYPGHFQYHHANHSSSPPPPPPPQQQQHQWGPPPPPPPGNPYPPPHHAQYSAYPPPPQSYPPPPPPPYANQDWGNANWSQHSGWEYPGAHGNEEDWAAKAKAWASARSAMEIQQPQSQYSSAARVEDPSHYANQYPQPVESHSHDIQHTYIPTSGFSNHQGPVTSQHRPVIHQQEPGPLSLYNSDPHPSFTANDGAPGGDMSASFTHHQGQSSSSFHQQEVPSSYSSIPGKEDSFNKQHGNSLLPADGRSVSFDHAHFAYGNQPLNLMDQPLEFAPRFNHESDPKMSSGYSDSLGPVRGTDSVASVASLQTWTAPAAPGASYPPGSPLFPSAQHDPVVVSPLPGQPSPLFGAVPGFQPPVPPFNAPLGLSAGTALHPVTAFPGDAYGAPFGSERSKKDALPNWLKEEIIKNKAAIPNPTTEKFKEGSQSFEDELVDKTTVKNDQADSKSMDSARSTEEDDDEDEVDAQRTAAINQEIKRVLTEVLLKVTDQLFDEIASKVLSEDDNAAKVLPPLPPVSAPKASAKVLIPAKAKDSEEHSSGGSSSESAGNVLGLANYASDEDDEFQASGVTKSEEQEKLPANTEVNHINGRSTGMQADHGAPSSKTNVDRVSKDMDNSDVSRAYSISTVAMDEKDGATASLAKATHNGHKETINGADVTAEKVDHRRPAREDSQEKGAKRHDRHESKKNSSRRDNHKDKESSKEREAEKDESHGRRDERHKKKDNSEDSKRDRVRDKKERSPRNAEKLRDSDSKKSSPDREGKYSKYERERDRKRSSKDDGDRKRERTEEDKGDKYRHRSSDESRHKRRRSSSADRVKSSKESPIPSDCSSDEVSDGSKRKAHSKRRNLSPSPTRSRRRQVSRSPHSKHTQRRHSPYSSLDKNRERRSRSRSRSPVRRHR